MRNLFSKLAAMDAAELDDSGKVLEIFTRAFLGLPLDGEVQVSDVLKQLTKIADKQIKKGGRRKWN